MLFLLVGLASLAGPVAVGIQPGFSFHCSSSGCADHSDLVSLAPEDQRGVLQRSADARAKFSAHVSRPLVRAGLAGANLIGVLPFALLMIFVGSALGRLAGRRGDDLARALPYLRRAAVMALVLVVAAPVSDSMENMILYPGTPAGPMWYFVIELRTVMIDLLLALAVSAVVWALDAGSRAERDVASFI